MKNQLFVVFLMSNFYTLFATPDVQEKTPLTPEQIQYHKCATLLSFKTFAELNAPDEQYQEQSNRAVNFLNKKIAENDCLNPLLYKTLHDYFSATSALQKKRLALAQELEAIDNKQETLHESFKATVDRQTMLEMDHEFSTACRHYVSYR